MTVETALAEIAAHYAVRIDGLLPRDAESMAESAARQADDLESLLADKRRLHDASNYVGATEQRIIDAYREAERNWRAAAVQMAP